MADLKPCPFCGGTDLRLNEFEQYAICNSCNAFGPSFDIVDECDAIAAWNNRATPPEGMELVEALRSYANCNPSPVVAKDALSKWEAAQK